MRTLIKFVTPQTLKPYKYYTFYQNQNFLSSIDSNTCVVASPSVLINLICFKEHLSTIKAIVDKPC